jgi:hypothetical protein
MYLYRFPSVMVLLSFSCVPKFSGNFCFIILKYFSGVREEFLNCIIHTLAAFPIILLKSICERRCIIHFNRKHVQLAVSYTHDGNSCRRSTFLSARVRTCGTFLKTACKRASHNKLKLCNVCKIYPFLYIL